MFQMMTYGHAVCLMNSRKAARATLPKETKGKGGTIKTGSKAGSVFCFWIYFVFASEAKQSSDLDLDFCCLENVC